MATGVASNYLSKKLLDHVFGATAFTAPATVYAALWTATLDDTSTGATAGVPVEAIGAAADLPGQVRIDFTNEATAAHRAYALRRVASFGYHYQTSKPIFSREIQPLWTTRPVRPF